MTNSSKLLLLKAENERLSAENKALREDMENALMEIANLVDMAIEEHEDALVELATMVAEME